MNMFFRKISALCLSVCLLCTAPAPVFAADSEPQTGTIGFSTWTLGDGLLTIEGEDGLTPGFVMPDENGAPTNLRWGSIAAEIVRVEIGEGVTGIPQQLFQALPNLTAVSIPSTVTYLGDSAFADCPKLQEVEMHGNARISGSAFENSPLVFGESEWQTLGGMLHKYVGTDSAEITVPANISIIGQGAFAGHAELTAVTLPAELTRIDSEAFRGCTELRSLEIPMGVEEIPVSCCAGCTALETVRLPKSVTTVWAYAFEGCTALREVNIPPRVTELGVSAGGVFRGCTSLERVDIQGRLTRIYEDCFAGCEAMVQHGFIMPAPEYVCVYTGRGVVLELPETAILLADGAFKNSYELLALTCPDTLRSIGRNALLGCRSLTTLRLNDGLVCIGWDALSGCSSLNELTVPASVTEFDVQSDLKLTAILGMPGTAAAQFAEENGIAFGEVPAAASGRDLTLDFGRDVWQFGNDGAVFGDSYALTDRDRALVEQLGIVNTEYFTEEWTGSCFGLALTVILGKNGLLGLPDLGQLEPNSDLISLINYYHAIQFTPDYIAAAHDARETSPQRFWRMIAALEDVPRGASPFLIELRTAGGLHAVVGCGVERGGWTFGGQDYDRRVLVWDPNTPAALTDSTCLYFDSETLDWHIPAYELTQTAGAGLIAATNDLAVLNAHPYPFAAEFPHGDADCDDKVTLADAVLLQRYLLGDGGLRVYANCDMNADGRLDARDLTMLKTALIKEK